MKGSDWAVLLAAVALFTSGFVSGCLAAQKAPEPPKITQTKAVPGSPAEKRAMLEKDMATFEIAYDNIRRDLEAVIKESK